MKPLHAVVPFVPRRLLPPFAGLVAFDAVLRHGSVTLAAAELGLTQSAVSHRLRALEEHFGTLLLLRLNPGLRATEAGARVSRELAPLLGTLAGLRGRVVRRPRVRPFRIAVPGAMLAWWLSPRLPGLAEAFPDLSIEVATWPSAAAVPEGVDLALPWLPRASLTGGPCELAFPGEAVFPVAAPRLLAGGAAARWRRDLPLLAKGSEGGEAGPEWSWAAWLGAEVRPEAMRFRDIGGALGAALDGNGVALARSLLVADALRRRRLVRLVHRTEARPCSKVQIARWRDPADAAAARMAAWLVAAAQEAPTRQGRGQSAASCAAVEASAG